MTEDTFIVCRKVKHFTRRWFKNIAQKSDIILCPSASAAEYYHDIFPKSVLFTGYTLNVDEFAAHINSRADYQGLAARIGQIACLSASRQHDIDLVSTSLAEIYRKLAG